MYRTIQIILISCSLIFLSSCQEEEQSSRSRAQYSETENNSQKGQAAVVDELSAKNILQIAASSADHTTLAAAVAAAELENVLVNAGPLTVFAPTNAAFDALPAGTVEDLLKPENKKTLAKIIKFHASPGKYEGDLFRDGMRLFQASGHYVQVNKNKEEVSIEGANILATIQASNGVVHVVDKVLLPPEQ